MLNKSMFYVIACCLFFSFFVSCKIVAFLFSGENSKQHRCYGLSTWTWFCVICCILTFWLLLSMYRATKRNLHKDCMQWNCKKAVTPSTKGKNLFSPSNIAILKLNLLSVVFERHSRLQLCLYRINICQGLNKMEAHLIPYSKKVFVEWAPLTANAQTETKEKTKTIQGK